ncbi:hypothetical protein EDD93_7638 [Streptomyces sp. 840.1]|uniref:hypothetical protein n=1 Tax=Streptomyces sp. 840.1 TaxID=2485152 RepID=UPI000FA3BE52|nr:hypothetical protein [Streptomyces sp. 840.1]ROQ60205.1 hypothetical protein EDD93_7638 [Streptomyces sp. 840.1]
MAAATANIPAHLADWFLVVNSQAYGPDVVELVGDVTRAVQAPAPAPRTSHRAG